MAMFATLPTTRTRRDDVTIILSTFNGEKFVAQQLDSLYAQTHKHCKILVRDDGSSDATPEILASAERNGKIHLVAGNENLGANGSFFELLKCAAATDAAYVAFCDQDDVWRHDKISRAVAKLSAIHEDTPAMYSSRAEIVDAELTHLGETSMPRRIGFGNALAENVCVGCTIVLNRRAVKLLCTNLPTAIPAHDWWCYLLVSCFGEIVFDDESPIKYRQHGRNVFGVARGGFDRFRRNLHRFIGSGQGRHWQSEQAIIFLALFNERIPTPARRLLVEFVAARKSFMRRIRLATSREIWRQQRIDSFLLRMLILMNRY